MFMIKKMKYPFCDYDDDHDDEDDVPLLGDGLSGEDLVTQLVLLAPLHPGNDHLVDFDQLLLLMAMILNYDDEDDDDNHNEINIFCSGLMRHEG